MRLDSGEELGGRWRKGKREGLGSLVGPRLEKVMCEDNGCCTVCAL